MLILVIVSGCRLFFRSHIIYTYTGIFILTPAVERVGARGMGDLIRSFSLQKPSSLEKQGV